MSSSSADNAEESRPQEAAPHRKIMSNSQRISNDEVLPESQCKTVTSQMAITEEVMHTPQDRKCDEDSDIAESPPSTPPDEEKIRFSMSKVKRPFSISCFREAVGYMVNDERVQLVILLMIVVNSLMMGIATFDFVSDNPKLNQIFEVVDRVFLIIFTVELAMQCIYHGFNLFRDGWLVFDFVVVIFSWAFSAMQGIRAFRIFRALRLVTRFATMRNLVAALLSTVPRMFAIAGLLLLIFYIFAVMFTDLFAGLESDVYTEDDCYYYFTSLDGTLFTLFQMMTLEWASIARSCMAEYTWAWLPFVVFVMVTSFIVFNLIIAVICDAVSELHSDDKEDELSDVDAQLQKRVNELTTFADTLMQNQGRIQEAVEALGRNLHLPAKELRLSSATANKLKNIRVPTESTVDTTESSTVNGTADRAEF